MANRQKGEVSIDVDGKLYTLALTLDTMAALEELFSTPVKEATFQEIATKVERGSVRHLRGLLWAVLQLHHPELTVKDISPLFQAGGGFDVWKAKFTELFIAAQPDPKDVAALGGRNGNPPAAQVDNRVSRGTGERSTSTPVALA